MNHRALIIFAKHPRPGEVKTRLGTSIGMDAATAMYRRFAEHAFQLADDLSSSCLRVYLFYAPGATEEEVKNWVGRPFVFAQQEGESLGERMQRAFERSFSDGNEQTVIIGTDVPELDVTTIQTAFESLSTSNVVLGPSTDGGYYLLGMNRLLKDFFTGIDWSTDRVLEQTIQKMQSQALSFVLLRQLSDIDTEEAYRSYLQRQQL